MLFIAYLLALAMTINMGKCVAGSYHDSYSVVSEMWRDIRQLRNRLSVVESETKTSKQAISKGNDDIMSIQEEISKLHRFGCLSGSKVYMYSNNKASPWHIERAVRFSTAFDSIPAVSLGITFLDSKADKNVRANTYATGISKFGFTLHLSTWGDTHQYALRTNWIACPKKE